MTRAATAPRKPVWTRRPSPAPLLEAEAEGAELDEAGLELEASADEAGADDEAALEEAGRELEAADEAALDEAGRELDAAADDEAAAEEAAWVVEPTAPLALAELEPKHDVVLPAYMNANAKKVRFRFSEQGGEAVQGQEGDRQRTWMVTCCE